MNPHEDSITVGARLWHPWLRMERLIRVILETRWGADEWPIVKAELRDAVKERSRLERAGWFNSHAPVSLEELRAENGRRLKERLTAAAERCAQELAADFFHADTLR